LNGRTGLPVHEVDERYTTTEAIASGAKDIDATSAAVILDQFLRARLQRASDLNEDPT
jgi:putative Holliday junction resolvase